MQSGGALGVAVGVDEYVDAVLGDPRRNRERVEVRHLAEVLDALLDHLPVRRAVRRTERVCVELDERAVVEGEDGLHEVGERVVDKVGAHVAHSKLRLSRSADGGVARSDGRMA